MEKRKRMERNDCGTAAAAARLTFYQLTDCAAANM